MEDDVITDDLLPNDSSVFQPEPDEEITKEVNAERAMISGAAPLIGTLLDWFDAEIALTDSIDGITLDATDIDIKAQLLARQLLKAKLETSRMNLINLRDEYIKT